MYSSTVVSLWYHSSMRVNIEPVDCTLLPTIMHLKWLIALFIFCKVDGAGGATVVIIKNTVQCSKLVMNATHDKKKKAATYTVSRQNNHGARLNRVSSQSAVKNLALPKLDENKNIAPKGGGKEISLARAYLQETPVNHSTPPSSERGKLSSSLNIPKNFTIMPLLELLGYFRKPLRYRCLHREDCCRSCCSTNNVICRL